MKNYVQINTDAGITFAREHPSECPICHVSIAPRFEIAIKSPNTDRTEAAYQCTYKNCQRLFIAIFADPEKDNTVSGGKVYLLTRTLPVTQQSKEFPEPIAKISGQFVAIYNEAYAAEQLGLKQICGVGYRKSLEFLIKDYLIGRIPDGPDKAAKEDDIKKKFLGVCIKDDIGDGNIKAVAQRATWLGNDETHYVRKWSDKDVTDLKKLISLTVNHMESEALTAQALADMPEPGK